ncbi:MAG: 2-C-methyl-D-erythritol 2,4-cyclodiphosphate synthase [Acidimicrobiales bacterium]
MRIGQGVDAHRFSDDPARALLLGLVEVPGSPGLAGHSDADVATHALCDALLGAAGRGDLGRLFPSHDAASAGIASRTLLARVIEEVAAAGFTPVSADLTILAERPTLAPFLEEMARRLSHAVGCPVSVKATTTDGLGALGRGEGIAASAVALIEERA